jgi:hypothetical protein
MKRIFSTFILAIVILSPVFTFLPINNKLNAGNVSTTAPDILDITLPRANTRIRGTVNISFILYDDSQAQVPYTIDLYDAQTCNVTRFGQIANSTANSNPNQRQSIPWDSRNVGLGTLAAISDGNYCLRICANLRGMGNNSYSACNGRNITVINNNRLPSITSIPSRLSILENEPWSYQIQANDPDGDRLTYRFVTRPSFLDINPQTGLITTNDNNRNPGNHESVRYGITVAVDDGMSGSVMQQFDLRIRRSSTITQPNQPDEEETPTPPEGPTTNHPTNITISSPNDEDIIIEEDTLNINWEAEDENGIDSILIEYSRDLITWTELETLTDINNARGEYLWDVSQLEAGEYFIRITVRDSIGTETSRTSGRITIREGEEIEEPLTSVPLIINTIPSNNSEIEDRLPSISGDLIPSEGESINTDTFKIHLNDLEITELCTVSDANFECTLLDELSPGIHKVQIWIRDSADKEAINEWTFIISGEQINGNEDTTDTANEETISFLGRDVPRGSFILLALICIIILLIVIIPWILYILWNKKKGSSDTVIVSQSNTPDEHNPISNNNSYGYYLPSYTPGNETNFTNTQDPFELNKETQTLPKSTEIVQEAVVPIESNLSFAEATEPVIPKGNTQEQLAKTDQFQAENVSTNEIIVENPSQEEVFIPNEPTEPLNTTPETDEFIEPEVK